MIEIRISTLSAHLLTVRCCLFDRKIFFTALHVDAIFTVLLLHSRIMASNASDAAMSFFRFAHRLRIFDKGTTRSVPC